MSRCKPACKLDLNHLSETTKQALQVLQQSTERYKEAIIQASLEKLLSRHKTSKQLDLEEQQLIKADRNKLTGLTAKQRQRLTTILPNQKQSLRKHLRSKAIKLARYQLNQLHRHYQKQKEQILLQEAAYQQQQKLAPQIYAHQLFQNLSSS